MATANESPPSPIHTLPPCSFHPISPHSPLTHVLFHLIFLSPKCPSPPIRTLIITPIHLLNKFLIFHSFNMAKPSQGAPFQPFHHSSPCSTSTVSHATFPTHTHCSAHLIYSFRTLLSDNSSVQHAFSTAASHSMSSSPPRSSRQGMVMAEELPSLSILTLPPCLLKVSQGSFTPLPDILQHPAPPFHWRSSSNIVMTERLHATHASNTS